MNENFGSMIRYLREKQGYSLKDLEDITGISPSYINRLERGPEHAVLSNNREIS